MKPAGVIVDLAGVDVGVDVLGEVCEACFGGTVVFVFVEGSRGPK